MNKSPLVILCGLTALLMAGCAQPFWGDKSRDVTAPGASLGAKGSPGKTDAKNDPKAGEQKSKLAMAKLVERRGQFAQAETLYKEIIEKDPKNPVPPHRLGVMYARQGKFKESQEQLARADALKPNDPEILGDIGYVHYLAHRLEEAERYLRRAMEIEPNNLKYSNNLALTLGALGRDQECLALFRRNSTGPQADVNYAFVLAQRGDYERALAVYDRALSEDRSMRVAAEAMIQLSRYAPDKGPGRSGPGSADGHRALAGKQGPGSTEPTAIGPRSDPTLVTIASAPRNMRTIPAGGMQTAAQNSPSADHECRPSPWPPNRGQVAGGVMTAPPVLPASWQEPSGAPQYPVSSYPTTSAALPAQRMAATDRLPSTGAGLETVQRGREVYPNAPTVVSQYPVTQMSPGSDRPIPCQIGPSVPATPTAAGWYQEATPSSPQYIATQPRLSR